MPHKSPLTELAEALVDRMEAMYEEFVEEYPVPFGMEQAQPGEWRRRWDAMTDRERAVEVQRMGPGRVIELLSAREERQRA